LQELNRRNQNFWFLLCWSNQTFSWSYIKNYFVRFTKFWLWQ